MNISGQQKYVENLISQEELSITGENKEKLEQLKQQEDSIDITEKICLQKTTRIESLKQKNEYATVECQHQVNEMISTDKLSSLEQTIQNISLSLTLDQVSTLKEKALTPFWNQQSMEISKKLYLPTKIDSPVSGLNCLNESSNNIQMEKSWFSINEKITHNKNSLMTSFQLSQYSLPDCTDLEVTQLKRKSEKRLKTLKGRLLPTENEKKQLIEMMEQSRWYYNSLVSCFYTHYGSLEKIIKHKKFDYIEIRNLLSKYSYIEKENEKEIIKYFKLKELYSNPENFDFYKKCVVEDNKILKEKIDNSKDDNEIKKLKNLIDKNNDDYKFEMEQFYPGWWSGKNKPYTRLPRGTAKKLSQNINSALSNYHNGNITKFKIKFLKKKKDNDFVLFEDENYPAFLNTIKSNYWFTDKKNRKKRTSLSEIINQTKKRGIEITYDKLMDKFYFHYSVDFDFFPKEDRRCENQTSFQSFNGERIIVNDLGVRKFSVGYDPNGKMIFIADKASKRIKNLLYLVDKTTEKLKSKLIWRKIKNLVNELHWKVICYFMKNYDYIMIPDFRISGMVKSFKISKMTKRLLYMYSYYSFKEKLIYKCSINKKKLYIVDESYTSKTCTICGSLNDVKGSEIYYCNQCNFQTDRDVNGARNIFIKNIRLR
jgi:transposase